MRICPTWSTMLAASLLLGGCAEGTGTDPVELNSGIYELATVALDGDCSLQDAISPGSEYVGKIHQVRLTVRDNTVQLEICDPFFDDCFTTVDEIGLIRTGDEVFAADPNWEIPSCTCFDDYRGSREVSGVVVETDRLHLRWLFEVPAPPAQCQCPEWQVCQAQCDQVLSRD